MTSSSITSRYRTTVPAEVRKRLGVRPGDVLQWEVEDNHVRVTAASPAFLALRGRFKVGPGDPVEDVRQIRTGLRHRR